MRIPARRLHQWRRPSEKKCSRVCGSYMYAAEADSVNNRKRHRPAASVAARKPLKRHCSFITATWPRNACANIQRINFTACLAITSRRGARSSCIFAQSNGDIFPSCKIIDQTAQLCTHALCRLCHALRQWHAAVIVIAASPVHHRIMQIMV